MTKKIKVVFRCDGNSQIGLGHLSRCIALAEMLESEFNIAFVLGHDSSADIIPDRFDRLILNQHIIFEKEVDFFYSQFDVNTTIFVLDGYQFDSAYVKVLHSKYKLVFIDDLHSIYIDADIVLNHAGGLKVGDFKTSNFTKLLLGPNYAMLRASFFQKEDNISAAEFDVLVSFGGSDPLDYTGKILDVLPQSLRKVVIIGNSYLNAQKLILKEDGNTKFYKGISAEEMANLMKKSASAVLSSSTISYEYLAVSSGKLYVVKTASNQEKLFNFLISSGSAEEFKGEIKVGINSKKIIDNETPKRILNEFVQLSKELEIILRKAESKDCDLVFGWINDPEVRKQSYSEQKIDYEQHKNWFMNKVINSNCLYFIGEFEGIPFGQIRFDGTDSGMLISYLIAESHRGKGLSRILLKLGVLRLLEENSSVKKIKAFVKNKNLASQKSFLSCNFLEEDTEEVNDSKLYTLIL